ncbi:MAG: ComEC/Rec2 family competence protein [Alistipes sp.]
MKWAILYTKLERMPMVKAVVPLMCGIVFAQHYTLPLWLVIGGFLLCGVGALLTRSALYTVLPIFLFGSMLSDFHTTESRVPKQIRTTLQLTVSDPPAARNGYSTTTALIQAWREGAVWRAGAEKVLLRADSTVTLRAGDRIICRGYVRALPGKYESYRNLMTHRGYVGTLWLSAPRILEQTPAQHTSLHLHALARIDRLHLAPDVKAVCGAMAAGDKSRLTPALRTAYSRSGTSHLLAVSGLHVGMVFLLVNLVLWWMPILRRGHLLRNGVAILLIWLYAATAGFSPSVVRAAVMFSALQLSLASTSTYVSMNILAATAFLMLLVDPNYLFDISFQLSFIAVTAILAWGMPIYRLLTTKHRAVNLLTATLVMGVVSAVSTAPLVSHFFGIVSLVGVVINPVVILLATIIVPVAVVWIILPITLLSPLFEWVLGTLTTLQNRMVEVAAGMPCGAFDYTLSTVQMGLIYLLFVVVTLVAGSVESKKESMKH